MKAEEEEGDEGADDEDEGSEADDSDDEWGEPLALGKVEEAMWQEAWDAEFLKGAE